MKTILRIAICLCLLVAVSADARMGAVGMGGGVAATDVTAAFTYINKTYSAGNATGTSLAVSEMNIAAGDLLVAWVSWEDGSGGTIAISDGASNNFTISAVGNYSTTVWGTFGYVLSAAANSTATITFTNSTSRVYRRVIVTQFRPDSGFSAILNPASSNPSYGSGGSGTAYQSGNITTQAYTLSVGGFVAYDDTVLSAQSIGGSAASVIAGGNLHSGWYLFQSSSMSNGAATATGGTSRPWLCGIISFKAE